jgi:hypothetical protein
MEIALKFAANHLGDDIYYTHIEVDGALTKDKYFLRETFEDGMATNDIAIHSITTDSII